MSDSRQATMWESPVAPSDETPIETGSAIVVLRLTAEERRLLRLFADEDVTAALHDLVDTLKARDADRG